MTQSTLRQKKYVGNIVVKGMRKEDAALDAGYNPNSNPTMIEKTAGVQNLMVTALKRAGLDEDKLALKIRDGLEANDHRFFTHEGEVVSEREVPDQSTRHKFLQTSLELMRYIKSNTIENLNLGVVMLPGEGKDNEWNSPNSSADVDKSMQNDVEPNVTDRRKV